VATAAFLAAAAAAVRHAANPLRVWTAAAWAAAGAVVAVNPVAAAEAAVNPAEAAGAVVAADVAATSLGSQEFSIFPQSSPGNRVMRCPGHFLPRTC
jgi:hypothetical protein